MEIRYTVNGSSALRPTRSSAASAVKLHIANVIVDQIDVHPHMRSEVDEMLDGTQDTVVSLSGSDKVFAAAVILIGFVAAVMGIAIGSI